MFIFAILFTANESFASAISWTDWSSVPTGSSVTATGAMGGIGVTLNGIVNGSQLTPNIWNDSSTYGGTYGGQMPSEWIQESQAGQVKITFGSAVTNPYITFISVGSPTDPVTYTFTGENNGPPSLAGFNITN